VKHGHSWAVAGAAARTDLARLGRHDRPWVESPKLPSGCFGMVDLVIFRKADIRRLLELELWRTVLGPFAEI
jgi:hypothetical protein